MANGSPGVNIRGVELNVPSIGLFSAADSIGNMTEESPLGEQAFGVTERWGGGIHWQGDGGLASLEQVICHDGADFTLPSRPGVVDNFPFFTYGAWQCSTYQTELYDEFAEKARRRHLAFEQYAVERQLFSDPLALGNNFLSGATSSSVEVSATALAPFKALARLEGVFSALYPTTFMIHMSPTVHSYILGASSNQMEKRGNVWVTSLGNIVVVGRGYSGNGPTGTAATATKEWIYATTPVKVMRGALMSINDRTSTVDRGVNDMTVYSMRLNAVTFDDTTVAPRAYPVDLA